METTTLNPVHELIKTQLDKIYNDAIEITGAFNNKYIHIDTLWELLNKSRLKSNKDLKGLDKNWNKMMDTLYEVSYRYCSTNKLEKRLPMMVFKTYIDMLKDNLA